MKRITTIIAVVLCSMTLYSMQFALEFFRASSDGKSVTVEWKSISESGVIRYDVERASSDNQFRALATIDAKGVNTNYRFLDDDAYMRGGSEQAKDQVQVSDIKYRLRVVNADNSSTYSAVITVKHSVSSVRRTWGMIKELFR